MADKGVITREDIMKRDALDGFVELKKHLQDTQKHVEGLIKLTGVYNDLSKDFKGAKTSKEILDLKKKEIEVSQKAADLLTKQRRSELEFQKIKEKEIAIQNKQITLENKIETQKKRSVTLTQQERLENSILNRAKKEQAILTSNLTGAYQKLNLKRTQAKKTLLDLLSTEKASNKEIEKARKNFQKLDDKVRKADTAVGDFSKNVGNYKSGISGFTGALRSLVGVFGVVEGLRLGFRIGQDLLAAANEAKGVEFAFQRLGVEGVFAFERVKKATKGLLSDLDVKKAIIEFDNFNLSADKLDTVLEFVAVRATQTGKSFDYLRDSAIEAISKESVRRADNLGLSQKELNDKIKEGSTFLEAFAEIAQREVKEAGNILEDAGSAQQKFNAELENFKVSAGSGFIKRFTEQVYDLGTAFVSVLTDINEVSEIIGKGTNTFEDNGLIGLYKDAVRLRDATKEYQAIFKEFETIDLTNINEIQAYIDGWSEMKKEVEGNAEATKILDFFVNKLKKSQTSYYEAARNADDEERTRKKEKLEKETEEEKKAREKREENQKRLNESFKKSEFELAQEQIKVNIEKNKAIATDNTRSFEDHLKANIALKNDLLKLNNNQINEEKRLLKERLDNGLISENEYNARLQILAIKKQSLNEEVDQQITDNLQSHLEKRFQDEKEKLDEISEKKKQKQEEDLEALKQAEAQKREIIGQTSNFIANALGLDATNIARLMTGIVDGFDTFSDKIQASLAVAGDVINSIANISAGFSQDRIAQIDFEIEKNDEKFNKLLANEQLTLEQRSLLEAQKQREQDKLEKKKRAEKTKQAKLEKANTLTQIAIQTSLGVISALAQVPKFDFGVSASLLAGIIGTVGAVQFALAAARPIPKFKDGHLAGTHQGWAITNDGGKQEVLERNGVAHLIQGVNTPIYMQKGDKVYKSEEDYHKRVANNAFRDLNQQQNRVKKAQELSANDHKINESLVASIMSREFSKYANSSISKQIKQGFKNVKVEAKFTGNNANTIYKNSEW